MEIPKIPEFLSKKELEELVERRSDVIWGIYQLMGRILTFANRAKQIMLAGRSSIEEFNHNEVLILLRINNDTGLFLRLTLIKGKNFLETFRECLNTHLKPLGLSI